MEHNRKNKLLVIIALVFSIASLSVGFAAFSTTLNISSSASVSPNSDTFSVKFSTNQNSLVESPVIPSNNPYNLVTTNGTIDNSAVPTIKGLSAVFTNPGQYVEYKFYARNEGEYTAYLNNVFYLGDKICKAETGTSEELVNNACDKIDVLITVGGVVTAPSFASSHTLLKKTGEEIVVRLEYKENATNADGPFTIVFPVLSVVYSTIDDWFQLPKITKVESGTLNDPGSIVSIGNEKFYVIGQENGNVKLLSMYNLLGDGFSAPAVQDTGAFQTIFSNTSTTYAGSIVERCVNNYKVYLMELGANIVNARLITIAELNNIGCNSASYTCGTAPQWVYSQSYWIHSDHDVANAWYVNGGSQLVYTNIYNVFKLGVRPVIEIPLSEF